VALWLPIAIWVVAFFRDPVREGPRGERLLLAPADGKVVSVIPMEEPTFLQGPGHPHLDLHERVQRAREPVPGRRRRGTSARITAGEFLNAAGEKASAENEQSESRAPDRAGTGPDPADRGTAGAPDRHRSRGRHDGPAGRALGLIRFGSRVDVFLPPGATVRVSPGETSRGPGVTVIAEWP
jgi:phosphatidylserine decarboxylase